MLDVHWCLGCIFRRNSERILQLCGDSSGNDRNMIPIHGHGSGHFHFSTDVLSEEEPEFLLCSNRCDRIYVTSFLEQPDHDPKLRSVCRCKAEEKVCGFKHLASIRHHALPIIIQKNAKKCRIDNIDTNMWVFRHRLGFACCFCLHWLCPYIAPLCAFL